MSNGQAKPREIIHTFEIAIASSSPGGGVSNSSPSFSSPNFINENSQNGQQVARISTREVNQHSQVSNSPPTFNTPNFIFFWFCVCVCLRITRNPKMTFKFGYIGFVSLLMALHLNQISIYLVSIVVHEQVALHTPPITKFTKERQITILRIKGINKKLYYYFEHDSALPGPQAFRGPYHPWSLWFQFHHFSEMHCEILPWPSQGLSVVQLYINLLSKREWKMIMSTLAANTCYYNIMLLIISSRDVEDQEKENLQILS